MCRICLTRTAKWAGQLLKQMKKAKGGGDTTKPKEHRLHSESGAKTLAELGVSEIQSHRWQKLADVPDDQFEAALAGQDMPTSDARARFGYAPNVEPERFPKNLISFLARGLT